LWPENLPQNRSLVFIEARCGGAEVDSDVPEVTCLNASALLINAITWSLDVFKIM
jgi:hypothetical protein